MNETAVKQYFETNATAYDGAHVDEERVHEMFLDYLEDGSRFLDIGAGNGAILTYVARNVDGVDGVGVDISHTMLSMIEGDDIAFVTGSATDLPIQGNAFEGVCMYDLLHHIVGESRRASKLKARNALEQAVEVLEPGGVLHIKEQYYEGPVLDSTLTSKLIFQGLDKLYPAVKWVEPEAYEGLLVSFYTRDEIRTMLEEAGLRIVNERLSPRENAPLVRKVLTNESGRIYITARKPDPTLCGSNPEISR